MGLVEVKWMVNLKVISNDYTLIYARHTKEHKRGVELLFNKVVVKSVMGYHAIADRI